jgi:hypothetical protein
MADLPTDDELSALGQAALAALPISWDGLVVNGHFQSANPDESDCVVALFGEHERGEIERQRQRAETSRPRAFPASTAPNATVSIGAAFDRAYDRASHRTLFVMHPFLSRDRGTGLVVVQLEEATPASGCVVDHWIFMRRSGDGAWERCPIPREIRDQLHLTEETGGAL